MAVLAIFKYEIKPGRMNDFMAKLGATADARFISKVWHSSVRAYRSRA